MIQESQSLLDRPKSGKKWAGVVLLLIMIIGCSIGLDFSVRQYKTQGRGQITTQSCAPKLYHGQYEYVINLTIVADSTEIYWTETINPITQTVPDGCTIPPTILDTGCCQRLIYEEVWFLWGHPKNTTTTFQTTPYFGVEWMVIAAGGLVGCVAAGVVLWYYW